MTPTKDITAILIGDGLALDRHEAHDLGAPDGETISVWVATKARHGSLIAHIVCLALWLVQRNHCKDQIANAPMQTENYIRAGILLVLFAPVVAVIGVVRRAVLATKRIFA